MRLLSKLIKLADASYHSITLNNRVIPTQQEYIADRLITQQMVDYLVGLKKQELQEVERKAAIKANKERALSEMVGGEDNLELLRGQFERAFQDEAKKRGVNLNEAPGKPKALKTDKPITSKIKDKIQEGVDYFTPAFVEERRIREAQQKAYEEAHGGKQQIADNSQEVQGLVEKKKGLVSGIKEKAQGFLSNLRGKEQEQAEIKNTESAPAPESKPAPAPAPASQPAPEPKPAPAPAPAPASQPAPEPAPAPQQVAQQATQPKPAEAAPKQAAEGKGIAAWARKNPGKALGVGGGAAIAVGALLNGPISRRLGFSKQAPQYYYPQQQQQQIMYPQRYYSAV